MVAALASSIPPELAAELVDAFLEIRRDCATSTLGRAAPGKFVESFVQTLQYLSDGAYDSKPKVDECLRTADTSLMGLDDGLRICAARIARSMYTLRNKRNILHKGEVDPNTYDLQFLMAGAQWILAELVRTTHGISMQDAGGIIEAINAPVGGIVEDFGGKRLVHGTLSIREEVLVLLHSHGASPVLVARVTGQLDRRSAGAVRNEIRRMWKAKLVQGDSQSGYRLTRTGLTRAIEVIRRETET